MSTPLTTSTKLPDFVPLRQGAFTRISRILSKDRLALFGSVLIILVLLAAVFGQWIAPYPLEGLGATNVPNRNLASSPEHWLGTDQLGRDILSRILLGAKPALSIALGVVALAALIGIPLGAIAGYRGGWVDNVLMRITEIFQAFPPLLLAMVMVAILGPSLLNAGIALAISWWPWYARLIRAEARSLRERSFVEAARSIGVPTWRILLRHILRNSLTPVLVQATVDVGTVVLAAGSLAFIGLGAQPPEPDWGLMVAEGRGTIFTHWWISTFPGLAIFITVLGFNLLGDSLRDILDPRQVKR
ncbi:MULTISPECIES: ABC transporter permease [unclassified Leucobacter]|uniref:ABC transporter permease n=1 Tax=unclassified Leucobacter TaxID=2621730 RepID=UPI00165E28E5|nr:MULTISPECIES: ABC transporter permease [unclassified Leucobacter]MBC9936716.1 ABC transporter permease [Leucobacter sp. cx-87]